MERLKILALQIWTFGDGECERDEYFEIITYEQDGYVLKLNVKDGEIFNISLKHTRK